MAPIILKFGNLVDSGAGNEQEVVGEYYKVYPPSASLRGFLRDDPRSRYTLLQNKHSEPTRPDVIASMLVKGFPSSPEELFRVDLSSSAQENASIILLHSNSGGCPCTSVYCKAHTADCYRRYLDSDP